MLIHTCSHLFTLVHTCSDLFTPVHTSVTIYALRAMAVSRWIFPLREVLFFDLTCYLVEIAYFCSPNRELSNGVWLEELYRKKISIPLAAHTTVTMYARRKMSFFALSNALILRSYVLSCWNCIPDGFFGLDCFAGTAFSGTTGVSPRKIVDPCRSPCLKILNWKRFERRNFLVLRPVLLKNAYFNSANPVLSKRVRLVELRWRKILDLSRGAS